MDGKHYEEFTVGDAYMSSWRYISESDLRQFLALTGLQEPLFESKRFLEVETDHKTWIVPGYLTMSYALGLFSRSGWIDGTGLAMLGAEDLEFTHPVAVGDEIRTRVEVVSATSTSSARGGIVVLDWVVTNQDDEVVVELTSSHFIPRISDGEHVKFDANLASPAVTEADELAARADLRRRRQLLQRSARG